MKILTYILAFFAVIICAVYLTLFTSFGNSFLISYVEKTIKEKSGFDVKFAKFQLNLSELNLIATINDEILVQTGGKFSLFSQKMDLNYTISANDLKTAGLSLTKPIGIKGQIRGKFSDFDTNGAGEILGSHLSFLANIKDYKPLTLTLDARKFSLSEFLALAKQPEYLSGSVDVLANIKENNSKPDGNATITLSNTKTNNALLQRDFNITLPANFTILANSKANINGDKVTALTQISTPIAKANANQTHYNITTKELKTDLNIDIADLAKLEPIIKQKLSGSLTVKADIATKDNKLTLLNAIINGLGGNIQANLNNTTLNAKINAIKLDEILKLAAQPALASATINGVASIDNINDNKNMTGKIYLKTDAGKLNQNGFKELGISIPSGVNFGLDINADVKNSVANFSANLVSSLLNIKNLNGSYNIENKGGNAEFLLDVSDLAKFESIVGTKLSGAVNLKAQTNIKDNTLSTLRLDGKALGGDVKAEMIEQKLIAELANLNLKDLFLLVGQQPLANASINLNTKLDSLDMKNLNGTATIELKNGEIYEAQASKILEKPIPKDINFNGKIDTNIQKSVANFSGELLSSLANLTNIKGSYDLNSNNANASLNATISELNKLKFLTQTPLFGSLELVAQVQKNGENLSAKVSSQNIANGKLNVIFKDEKLKANLDSFDFKGLSDLLGYSHFYSGIGSAKLNYSTKNENGDFDITIKEGKLVANDFTKAIKTLTQRDITSEIYKDGLVRGNIAKTLITFDAQMQAQRSDINTTKAMLNTATSAINIPLDFRYEKTDAKINITGTTKEPKYTVSSEYIKNKISKEIGRFLDKQFDNDSNQGGQNTQKDAVKELLKGLFN
ncbi:hypothetical protein U5B43_04840 [Campylobacter sp. 9BO]|uniref:hypothetical protein n=1 Tax=Campylobacter sp. 9BO TaxID=3424759 RepID=UPI003D34E505